MSTSYRPRFGIVLSIALWVASAGAFVDLLITGSDQLARVTPWLALTSLAVWAVFWNPRVEVNDSGVHLVNVLRTIDLPWPSIQAVDTKWALAIKSSYGTFTAWAAPAPGIHSTYRNQRTARTAPPGTARGPGAAVRPGDLPGSPSGDAAAAVNRRWEELREGGHLDDPRLEFDKAPVTWHWPVIAGGGVLLLACLLTLVL